MVVAQEMQRAVNGQQSQFLRQGHTLLAGLTPRPGQGNHDVAEVALAGRPWGEGSGEGENVGHVILPGEAGVESSEAAAVGEDHGHLAGAGARLPQRGFGRGGHLSRRATGGHFPTKVNAVFHEEGGAGSFDSLAAPPGAGASTGVSG